MSVAVLSHDDIRQIVADTIRETLAAQQPVAQTPAQVAEPGRLALTKSEAAKSIGVCERTIDTLRAKGLLKSTKVGERVLIPIAELERFLREQSGT